MPHIRPAREADVELVAQLQASYYQNDRYSFDPQSAVTALKELQSNDNLGRLWVIANSDGTLAGYFAVTFGFSLEYGGRDAFLDELYVSAPFRSLGIGSQALEVAEAFCRECGVRALHLEVEPHRPRAQALYERSGFSPLSRRRLTKSLS